MSKIPQIILLWPLRWWTPEAASKAQPLPSGPLASLLLLPASRTVARRRKGRRVLPCRRGGLCWYSCWRAPALSVSAPVSMVPDSQPGLLYPTARPCKRARVATVQATLSLRLWIVAFTFLN